MPFQALRANPVAFPVTALVIAVPGLFLGPALMLPAYRILQPVLGALTLLVVEMLFAFVIDLPLAAIASTAICRITRANDPADGALAGVFFLLVFGVLIVACVAASSFGGSFIASLALLEVFPPAAASALRGLGGPVLGVSGLLFCVFDFTLCGAGGIVGYHASRLFRRD
jgi:hypothetical protein